MKEFKSLLEDAEKLISYDADDQEAPGTSGKPWQAMAAIWQLFHHGTTMLK